MKQIIRLTESDLHRLVKESVQRILAETDASSSGDVNRPVFPMMRRPSPVGEPINKKVDKLGDDASDRKGGKNHSLSVNYVGESVKKIVTETDDAFPAIKDYPVNDAEKRKAIAAQDRDRVSKLTWSNEYKNHPNRSFFSSDMKFGAIPTWIEEAAFQILGFERFEIGGVGLEKGMMPPPWEDIYHILKWAIENKGLNPNYLRRVSNKDWQAQPDEVGLQPDIMSSDEWNDYTRRVMDGEEKLFTREQLREISALLPQKMKEALYHDLINISRIGIIEDATNHILAMNDGENAVQFCNAVRSRIFYLRRVGVDCNKYNVLRVIVADALKEVPQIQSATAAISNNNSQSQ